MTKNKKQNTLVIEGSSKAWEYIQQLWKSGELAQMLGVTVSDISAWENLSQWFNDVFEPSWQTVPAYRRISSQETAPVTRAKEIDLDGKTATMVISLKPAENKKTDIIVKIEPTSHQKYLPEGLQLIVKDDLGNAVSQAQAESRDNWIQLRFQCSPETKFIVQVILGNASITENFVIDRLEKQPVNYSRETELIFRHSIDYKALTAAIEKVQEKNEGTELSIEKIEDQEDELVSVILQVTSEANKEKIKRDIEAEYHAIREGNDKITVPTIESELVGLRDWFENWFTGGWQPEKLAYRRAREGSSRSSHPDSTSTELLEVKGTKLIKFGRQMPERSVVLVVRQTEITSSKIEICLRLYPASGSKYLPDGVQLIVLNESGEPIPDLEAQAEADDDWLQLEFFNCPGTRFSIKVALDDETMTENFVI